MHNGKYAFMSTVFRNTLDQDKPRAKRSLYKAKTFFFYA